MREAIGAVQAHYRSVLEASMTGKSPRGFLPVLVGLLFDPPPPMQRYAHALTDGVAAAYGDDEALRGCLREVYEDLDVFLHHVLLTAFPEAPPPIVRHVSYTLLCLSEAHRSMLALGFDPSTRGEQVRHVTNALLAQLGQYGSASDAAFRVPL